MDDDRIEQDVDPVLARQASGAMLVMAVGASVAFLAWMVLTIQRSLGTLETRISGSTGVVIALVAVGMSLAVRWFFISSYAELSRQAAAHRTAPKELVDTSLWCFDLFRWIFSLNLWGCLGVLVAGTAAALPAGFVLVALPMGLAFHQRYRDPETLEEAGWEVGASVGESSFPLGAGKYGDDELAESEMVESLENEARLLASLAEMGAPAIAAESQRGNEGCSLGVPEGGVSSGSVSRGNHGAAAPGRLVDGHLSEDSSAQATMVSSQSATITAEGIKTVSGETFVGFRAGDRHSSLVVQFYPPFEVTPEVELECGQEGVRASVVNATPVGCRIAMKRSDDAPLDFHLGWSATSSEIEAE